MLLISLKFQLIFYRFFPRRFFVSFKVIIDFQVQHTDFIFPLPPLFQVAISTPTFMWAFFPHPVAIHAHTKATFGADPVQVEDRGVTDVAHLANATNRTLPGHLSCGQQRDSQSVQTKFSTWVLLQSLKNCSDMTQTWFWTGTPKNAFVTEQSKQPRLLCFLLCSTNHSS